MTDEVRAALRAAKLFLGVDHAHLEPLLDGKHVVQAAAGTTLIEADQDHVRMFVVLRGAVTVHLESVDADPVAMIGSGEAVGELGIIDGEPGSAFVVTSEDSVLLSIDEPEFWRLLQTSHAFARNILRELSGRLRNNNRTVSTESRRREELQRAVIEDRLTGVFNRHWLEEELPAACNRAFRERGELSIAVIDIDHFKRFNDDHGHQAGDRVLEAVAQTLRESLRQGDVVARYGGEEFVVLCPGAALTPAARVAERLRRAVQRLRLPGLPPVRISVGVAQLAPDDSPSTLVARADAALYEAKTGGRNRVVCADPAMRAA